MEGAAQEFSPSVDIIKAFGEEEEKSNDDKERGSDKVPSRGQIRRNIKLKDDQLQWIMDWNRIFGRIFSWTIEWSSD